MSFYIMIKYVTIEWLKFRLELSLNIVCEIDFMHTLVINFIDPVQMNLLLP